MAQLTYNIHRDRLYEAYLSGKTFGALLLQATVAGAQDPDLDTVADLLAVSGVDECDFTNYARKTLASVTSTEDDSADAAVVAAGSIEWEDAGGAVDNTPVAMVIYETGASDAVRYLVGYFDENFGEETSGDSYVVGITVGLLQVT